MVYNGLMIGLGNILPNSDVFNRIRVVFYKLGGIRVGKKVVIAPPLFVPVDGKGFVRIGDHTYINALVRFGPNGSGVSIGNHCLIGPRVSFETGSHSLLYDHTFGREHLSEEIVIEDRVWIGANAVILKGVTIGHEAVIAAGAVVTRDVPPRTVWGGIPAKELKKLSPDR